MSKRHTRKSYKSLIKSVGLDQRQAARFLDINERTSRRYASGDWPMPRSTAILLCLMARKGIKPESAEGLL